MSVDLRLRHDRLLRERAAEPFDEGWGYRSVAKALGIPAKAVRRWKHTYLAVGRDGLPRMGRTHSRYDLETKVAAARAVSRAGWRSPRRWPASG